jgi:hypothetical protein
MPPDVTAWQDVLTGTVHRGPELPLKQLTRRLPVALLTPAAPGGGRDGGL